MQQENEQWIILRVERGSEFFNSLQMLTALNYAQCTNGLLWYQLASSPSELALKLFKVAQKEGIEAELSMHLMDFDNTNSAN